MNFKKILILILMVYGFGFMISSTFVSYFIIINIFEKDFIMFIEPNRILLWGELISIIITFISAPFIVYYLFKEKGVYNAI